MACLKYTLTVCWHWMLVMVYVALLCTISGCGKSGQNAEAAPGPKAFPVKVVMVQALQASIREQRVQLHYYTVNAPTSGIIGDVPVHVGDRVTSQTIITTLDRGGSLEAYIYVPAEKSAAVRVGMPIDILDETGKTL